MTDVLLISGGLDSIAAWRLLDCPPAIFFEHGQKALPREQRALVWAAGRAGMEWGCPHAHITARLIPPLTVQENGYVPYRNAIFCLLAANYTGADRILIAQVAEWAPDKNLRFYRRLGRLMNEMTRSRVNEIDRRVVIEAPFAGLTKGRLLEEYCDEFGYDQGLALAQSTWSCYQLGASHCGECSGCLHRMQAELHVFSDVVTHFRVRDAHGDWEGYVRRHYFDRAQQGGLVDGWRWLRGNGIRSAIARARAT